MRQVASQAAHPYTFKLALEARGVYAILCALIAPGESRRLSQAGLVSL